MVERIYPFDQAVEALQYAATGRARGNSSFSYRHERQEDEGQDITGVPLLRRRELLKKVLAENEVIRFSGAVEGEGKRFFELAGQRGLEGIVAKRKDSTYQPGRRSKS